MFSDACRFSSIVEDFIIMRIPEYCSSFVKNQYHNGHPDLIPKEKIPGNAAQYTQDGIEVKASRHSRGRQGHNPGSIHLMVFYFDSNTPKDRIRGIPPQRFCFKGVYTAKLDKDDWAFSGRSETG
ncbi:MAG: hypothetical protein ACUVWS_18640, partial [Roseiflexus sp.]